MHCRRLLSARAIRSLAWCHAPHARRSLMVKTKAEVVPAFYAVVNMSRDELEEWLDTPRCGVGPGASGDLAAAGAAGRAAAVRALLTGARRSNAVGQKLPGADESTGHQSGPGARMVCIARPWRTHSLGARACPTSRTFGMHRPQDPGAAVQERPRVG